MFAQAVGSSDEAIHVPPRTGEVVASALDPSEARVAIGWQPSLSVAEGAMRVLAAQSASKFGPWDPIGCAPPCRDGREQSGARSVQLQVIPFLGIKGRADRKYSF